MKLKDNSLTGIVLNLGIKAGGPLLELSAFLYILSELRDPKNLSFADVVAISGLYLAGKGLNYVEERRRIKKGVYEYGKRSDLRF